LPGRCGWPVHQWLEQRDLVQLEFKSELDAEMVGFYRFDRVGDMTA
jgi:hypothetical protein